MSSYFRQDFLDVPDGASLFYQVEGEGQPGMVLCDGLGCDGFAWRYLQPYLKRHFRVLRWHYRGHGRSGLPQDRERIGMSYTCDDLARVMDVAGLERAVLFGHSMGVQVALEFHRQHPGRVAGLVLICGAYGTPLDTWHGHDRLRRIFPYVRRLVERFPVGTAHLTRALLSTEVAIKLAITAELNRDFIRPRDLVPYFAHLARMDPVVFVRTLDALASHTAWDHLPRVDVPTLVIGGDRDRFTPGHLSEEMARRIPGAELLMARGGSHTTPLEYPDLVELRVERFLRTRVLGRTGMPPRPADEPSAA